MSREEESPSGPPNPSQVKHSTFKVAATFSPTGNLFITSLSTNAEIKVNDLCFCVKKTSDFPPSPTLVQWISSIYGTKLQATIFQLHHCRREPRNSLQQSSWRQQFGRKPLLQPLPLGGHHRTGAGIPGCRELPSIPHWTVWIWVMVVV